ncbi:MAG: DUF4097 domain-containing protein [Pyrinomonadaceae bacterium]|nr:DUF4097 domain-containing protein [Pyrinomonadaceae bacterium]
MIFTSTTARQISFLIGAFFLFAPFCRMFAQTVPVEPKIVIAPANQKVATKQNRNKVFRGSETSAEKSIVVDAKVNISLCIAEGRLKINGWERSEIRVFVGGGGEVGFKVLQKNKQNNAVWVMVTGFGAAQNREKSGEECLSGEEIELDVPRGAVVNVKGSASEMTIEAVRKVDIKIVSGDISLNNIAEGINAATYNGDVTVENSGGAMTLESANGSIVAFDAAPSEIGDIFKAKTSGGAITLQQIEYRQTEISSNTGSLKFTGEFQNGGQYDFRTVSGGILLVIPEKSSCKLNATYGFGRFNSELKLDIITENNTSKARSIVGSMGKGDANVNLTTYSGAIRIKKQ